MNKRIKDLKDELRKCALTGDENFTVVLWPDNTASVFSEKDGKVVVDTFDTWNLTGENVHER